MAISYHKNKDPWESRREVLRTMESRSGAARFIRLVVILCASQVVAYVAMIPLGVVISVVAAMTSAVTNEYSGSGGQALLFLCQAPVFIASLVFAAFWARWFERRRWRRFLSALGAVRVPREGLPRTRAALDDVRIAAGLAHVPYLYVVPSRSVNAVLVGSVGDYAIAITSGLAQLLTRGEQRAVMAHLMSRMVRAMPSYDAHPAGFGDAVEAPSPAAAQPYGAWVSTTGLADSEALQLTRDPAAVISALDKARAYTPSMRVSAEGVGWLFWRWPEDSAKQRGDEWKRMAAIRKVSGAAGSAAATAAKAAAALEPAAAGYVVAPVGWSSPGDETAWKRYSVERAAAAQMAWLPMLAQWVPAFMGVVFAMGPIACIGITILRAIAGIAGSAGAAVPPAAVALVFGAIAVAFLAGVGLLARRLTHTWPESAILRRMGAIEPDPAGYRVSRAALAVAARESGLPVSPRLYVLQSSDATNAMVVGMSAARAVVIITPGVAEDLTEDEQVAMFTTLCVMVANGLATVRTVEAIQRSNFLSTDTSRGAFGFSSPRPQMVPRGSLFSGPASGDLEAVYALGSPVVLLRAMRKAFARPAIEGQSAEWTAPLWFAWPFDDLEMRAADERRAAALEQMGDLDSIGRPVPLERDEGDGPLGAAWPGPGGEAAL